MPKTSDSLTIKPCYDRSTNMHFSKILSFLVVLFICKNIKAGCEGPSFYTTNGIVFYSGYSTSTQVVNLNESTFFSIYLRASNCIGSLTKTRIFFNDILVDSFANSVRTITFTILQRPGHYRITSLVNCTMAGIYNTNFIWNFDLYQKPIDVVNPILTSMPEPQKLNPELNPELLLYPNPATNNITILNETEEIKNVSIYNLSGQIIQSTDVLNTKVEIPLDNYPPGIYFINVATLSDKTIIKKFTVL